MPSSDALRDCSNTASQNSTMEENSQPQRKRPASSLVNHSNNDGAALGTKRNKLDANNQSNNDASAEEPQNGISETSLDFTTAMTDFSVERLLSVPLEILFRQVPSSSASLSHKRKPLLTRAEARLLSKTTLLAAEMDTILHVSSQALSQQVWCAQFSQSIESVPWLRSVVGLLRVHSTHISSAALHHLQQEMNRILQDLSSCAAALAHYAEQNWTVSESLLDAFGDDGTLLSSGQELAQHKKFLAELQEEVSSRIQTLLNDEEILKWAHGSVPTPMTQFCQQLFGIKQDTTETTNPEAIQQEQPTASLEQEDNHGENETLNFDTNKRGGAVSAMEKEHDPKEPLNENPLLALAQEAEEHAHQWSASTVSIHSPVKKHSPMETDESEEEEHGEMTQGTSNAVAALTVLASAGRGT